MNILLDLAFVSLVTIFFVLAGTLIAGFIFGIVYIISHVRKECGKKVESQVTANSSPDNEWYESKI